MEKERLWREFAALTEQDQCRVANFIVSLIEGNGTTDPAGAKTPSLEEEPFVGMWQGRQDMHDSRGWLSKLREQEWTRYDG